MDLKLILWIAAIVCFLLKAFGVPAARVDFMNLGFAFVVAGFLV